MKTAGQTICDILRRSFGSDHCDLRCATPATPSDLEFARRLHFNLRSIAGHSVRPWGELAEIPSIRFYTFLRNPISRCLSHYQFDRVRNGKQVDFLVWAEQYANYQTRFLSGSDEAERAIEILHQHVGFVGLVEDFDRSIRLLRDWSGETLDLNYRSRNRADDDTIKADVLSNPTYVEAMHYFNQADKVVYQYARDEIYRRLTIQYAASPILATEPCNRPMQLKSSSLLASAKRNLVYKPLAKARQALDFSC